MRTLLTALFMTMATLVSAQDDDPFGVTLYGSFLHTTTVPNALFFFNDIEEYDGFELRRAMRNHEIDTVVLASNGGNVFEGLNMAGIIHDNELTTYVPRLPGKMGCYSACAYMFFGSIRSNSSFQFVYRFLVCCFRPTDLSIHKSIRTNIPRIC